MGWGKTRKFAVRFIYGAGKKSNVSPKSIIFTNTGNPACAKARGIRVGTTETGSSESAKLFGENVFSYPKPELFIHYLLHLCTKPGDLVLDFHLGSGTTASVAHKMGRQYIA
ncbi:DNA methyltransferase [Rothia sp. P7208]|uniref:DNA methyltransferase n=1 Tax=Rothia sp. P7208 TaxID=3402660 RepID=UPI003ACABF02